MVGNGRDGMTWGLGIEGKPSAMLRAAIASAHRNGNGAKSLPPCTGEACVWIREIAECLHRGTCRVALLFCDEPGTACCVANKVPGVRAVAVGSVPQARQALRHLGANLLAVESAGRTYYECREMLRLCQECDYLVCPPGVACVLRELDGHAHR